MPKDFQSLFKLEKQRYKQKGYGLLVALAGVFLFFYYIPSAGHYIWPRLLN